MDKNKQTQEILPWNNDELKLLLENVIAHGIETSKIDFKTEVETSTQEQKAELLKDISAIANTYDNNNYRDHGFLVYGVKSKTITGISQTETDTDKFQNTIEQLLKTYISPMPQIYVIGFETIDNKKWGVIVIPPRNNKPHMFFKDLFCSSDRTRSRKKGEWFVRNGATTDPGLPENLAIINQQQIELSLEPLRESVRSLQSRVVKTEEQYNSALFKLIEHALLSLPENNTEKRVKEKEEIKSNIEEALGVDLPTRFKQKLSTPQDALIKDIIAEAKSIQDFLEGTSTGIPWTPQLNNPIENKKAIEDMEEKVKSLQISIATIVLNDNKNLYTDALLRVIKIMAKVTEVPAGTTFNRFGENIRYYPLGIILYTIFICGTVSKRVDLLKKVLQVPLKYKTKNVTSSITNLLFYWNTAQPIFNDAMSSRFCAPIAQRVRQLISNNIGEMLSEYSEPEYFFRGEFTLALTHIDTDIGNKEGKNDRFPIHGLYLYMHEANNPITEIITNHSDFLDKLYKHPLNEILEAFDTNAHKLANSGCITIGVHDINTSKIYSDSLLNKK